MLDERLNIRTLKSDLLIEASFARTGIDKTRVFNARNKCGFGFIRFGPSIDVGRRGFFARFTCPTKARNERKRIALHKRGSGSIEVTCFERIDHDLNMGLRLERLEYALRNGIAPEPNDHIELGAGFTPEDVVVVVDDLRIGIVAQLRKRVG